MPSTYIWIPSKDKDFEWFALGQCQGGGVRYLKRPTETLAARSPLKPYVASWRDVKTNDHLMIGGHGFAASSEKIGWIGTYPHSDVVTWTFEELARAIGGMTTTNGIGRLDFTLCMCWGADAILDKAFAGRFASVLQKYSLVGTVTAFPGKMVINGFSSKIVINGTNRATSAVNKYKGNPTLLPGQVEEGNVPGHDFAENVALKFAIPT